MMKDFTSAQQARDRPPDSMASATSQRQRGIFDTRCGLLHEGISVMLHNLQPDSQQQYVERIQGNGASQVLTTWVCLHILILLIVRTTAASKCIYPLSAASQPDTEQTSTCCLCVVDQSGRSSKEMEHLTMRGSSS